jgi:N-methylhydantoinase A
MAREASDVVAQGSFGAPITQTRIAYMRYVGQGHEIPVPLPARTLTQADVAEIRAAYDTEYTRWYDRPVPGSDVEIMSYAVLVTTVVTDEAIAPAPGPSAAATAPRTQLVRDTATGAVTEWAVHDRASLANTARIAGPAIIAEDETSTLIGPGWTATLTEHGYIDLRKEAA